MPNRALSLKQRAFVNAYAAGPTAGNQTQSAIKAGYATSSAHTRAAELVQRSAIRTAVADAQQHLATAEAVDRAWVIAKLVTVVNRSLQEVEVLDREGEPTGEYRFDAAGATGALKLIGQHYGMVVDRVAVQVEGERPLARYTLAQLTALLTGMRALEAAPVVDGEAREVEALGEGTLAEVGILDGA